MEQVLDDMEGEMRQTFRDELEVFYRMSGVFIQMLMYDAEKSSSVIKADVNFMENYKALQDMKAFEDLVMNQDFTLTKKATIKAQLPAPVKIERVVVQDESVVQDNKALQRQVTELQDRLSQIDTTNPAAAAASTAPPQASSESNADTEVLKQELAETKAQLDMKVNQTPAVQNMKKMLQEKNATIAELREKLAAYEAAEGAK